MRGARQKACPAHLFLSSLLTSDRYATPRSPPLSSLAAGVASPGSAPVAAAESAPTHHILAPVPEDSQNTLIGKIFILATPRLAGVSQYHGPWEPEVSTALRSVWSSSGAGLETWGFYGRERTWKVTLPSYVSSRQDRNSPYQWSQDGTYEK